MRFAFLWTFASILAAPLALAQEHARGLCQPPARLVGHTVWLSPQAVTLQSSRGSLQLRFANANPSSPLAVLDPLPGASNYLRGRDPQRWITGLPAYARVRYKQFYPGIDLVCHGSASSFEYDFEVSPGADPARIRISFGQHYAAGIEFGFEIGAYDRTRWSPPWPSAPRVICILPA
jgi:hypothetical protein